MSPRILVVLAAALTLLGLALPVLTPPQAAAAAVAAPVQTLTWTADDSMTAYKSVPGATALPGETKIVFENSEATGNTSGMTHSLTFDTSTPGYNHDVSLNILASPFDTDNGRHEATVTLTPGKYRYFCSLPGHAAMVGEFIVAGDSPDTTPPTVNATVTGEKDPQGNYLKAATVTLAATDSQSGVSSVEYKLDSAAWAAYTAPVVVNTLGAHMVHYRATDTAGNTSAEGMSSFTVVEGPVGDKTPPTVTASVAGDRDTEGNYLDVATVTVVATDAESGVDKVEYQVDGGAWTAYTATVAVNAPGMHMLHYRATDKAGNTSPEGMSHFTVVKRDTTAPVVTAAVTGTKDADGNYVGKATVTVTASDAGSGVAKVEYKVDTAAWTAYSVPVAVTTAGVHTVSFRATDQAGNVSTEGTVTFTVVEGGDSTAPVVSLRLTGEQNGDWAYVDKATVTLTATDAQSGVDSVEYRLDSGAWTKYTAPVVVTALGQHTLRYRATDLAGNVAAEQSGSFTVAKAAPKPDACPDSDTRETVILGAVDSQVENIDIGNGCTINDVIDADAEYASNDRFVKHVKAVTKELVDNGVLSASERNRIVTAAIDSGVGGSPSAGPSAKPKLDAGKGAVDRRA